MKILQINTVCGQGSTGRIAVDLYKELENKGHECVIAYGRGTAPQGIRTIKIGTRFDVYAHALLTRITDRHGFYSTKATIRLIEEIKSFNPDIIHLHNLHGYYINIEVLFNYLTTVNKTVVWTLHDCWAFTGHCAYFDFIGCHKWKTGCFKCPQHRNYPASLWTDHSQMNYERKKKLFTSLDKMVVVTPSNWLANLVQESFLSKYPIKVIPNGIDLDVFKPVESNFRRKYHLEDKIIILGVANIWDKRKGLDDFVSLSHKLDEKYQIILVGLNAKQIKKIPETIIGIKRTNNVRELAEIYTAANVFVNPTYEDNFPTTNLEALACGTPVVTYDTGGSVECIDDSCGTCVLKGNVAELVEEIERAHIINKSLPDKKCFEAGLRYNKHRRYQEYLDLFTLS